MGPDHERNGWSVKELYEEINTYRTDLAYSKALSATSQILRDEEYRALRVELLLVSDERDELREHLNIEVGKSKKCERGRLEMQYDLMVAVRGLEKAEGELRACSSRNEALDVEIRSANSKASALLADKLALDSEITSLRGEIQSLKSQAEEHQAVLLEKSALERRLSSLQQELENMKQSTQAAQTAHQASQSEEERLQSKARTLEAELDQERRQRVQAEESSQKISSVWESKYTTLEQRSNSFRAKLRVTMEQLKACQAELRDSHANLPIETGPLATGAGRKGFAKPSLKRNSVQQQEADSMIGTPGDIPAAKRSKKSLTLPGDKSAFSITPFLNRASSIALDSPTSEVGHIDVLEQRQKSHDHLDDREEPDEPVVATAKGSGAISKLIGPHSRAAQPKPRAIGSKGNLNTKTSLIRNSKISLSLEDVSETEENDLNDPLEADKTALEGTEKQKRKRKVLIGRLHKPVVKDDQPRKLAATGREKLAPPSASTFGDISPLKRKRKPLIIDPQDATA